jgi:hypothetical protein
MSVGHWLSFPAQLLWPARCAACDAYIAEAQTFCAGCQLGLYRQEGVCLGCALPARHITWNPERVPDLPRWNSGGEAACVPTRLVCAPIGTTAETE